MNKLAKSFVFVLLIFLSISFIFSAISNLTITPEKISLSEAIQILKEEQPTKVVLYPNKFEIILDEEKIFTAEREPNVSFSETLQNFGFLPEEITALNIEVKGDSGLTIFFSIILPILLPVIILGFLLFYSFRRANQGAMQIFSFSRSNIRLFSPTKDRITFKDVAGLKEAKEELKEVVEFLKTPKKFYDLGAKIPRGVLLMGPPGSGKCIVGNSLILTNKGLMEIKDVSKYFSVDSKTNRVYGAKLPTIVIKNPKDKVNSASHWYNLGRQETIKITLRQGFDIEGTPEHPIVVLNENGELEFRPLKELKENDFVAIKFNTQFFGSLKEVSPDKAYIMGLLTGDGNLSQGSRLGLTSTDTEIANSFRNYIHNNYEEDFKIGLASDGITQTIASWKVKKDLYNVGMNGLLSYDKSIPDTILQAPKETVVAFLQGLFDTDGYFERSNVGYSTISKKLADQIMMMLLNLGVIPSRRIKAKFNEDHPNSVYEIIISGTSLEVFKREVGFRLSRKQKLLEDYLTNHRIGNTNIDIFPYITDTIVNQWTKLSKQKLSNSYFANLIDKIRDRRRVSRKSLGKILDLFGKHKIKDTKVDYLRSLYSSNLLFSPIKKIEPGEGEVYDFTVPKNHSFISNGFISHNTLLARAVAGEARVPFFHISGSEFVEMFVGVGASRVRDTFATAKKSAPSILFVDEIDAIGRVRGAGLGGGHDEREQTLNQILVEMDGFDRDTKIIVIAATNRPDVLDPALLRPGRFDRRVILDMPSINDREEILKIHIKGKSLEPLANLREIAERTPGFSGADLANLVNEAAILAARRNKKNISQQELLDSIEKVILGPERKSRILTKKEKEITAYHETGHALITALLPSTALVRKISIITRGRAAGYTMRMPAEEKYMKTHSEFLDDLCALLGGYVAEEIKFKDISTGAANDLSEATNIARSLVTKYGMSKKIGPISFGETEEFIFLGREITTEKDYSEETAAKIDNEVFGIIRRCYQKTKKLLQKNINKLEKITQELIKKETLEKEEFEKLIK